MNFLQTFRSSKRELFHTLSQSPFLKLPTLEVKQPSLILPDHHYQRPYPKAGGVAVEQASAKKLLKMHPPVPLPRSAKRRGYYGWAMV
ncbi:hypothetical protein L210DRAFT_3587949, partial [Boletus edulis BED1]